MYDRDQLLAELNASNTAQVVRRYVYGADADEPLVWYEGAGTSDRRFLHEDERGSVVAVTDSAGGALAVNTYDEHGVPAATNSGRFQYTGQAWMDEIGLYYYKARMYSFGLGRFLQTDPIGYEDGMNLYEYAGDDPVNATDPSGLKTLDYPGWVVTARRWLVYSLFGPQATGDAGERENNYDALERHNNEGKRVPPSLQRARALICRAVTAPHRHSGTLQIGGSATGNILRGGGLAGAGVAIDLKGNVALYSTIGLGRGKGLSGQAGLAVAASNAYSVQDLRGGFWHVSGSAADGVGGTVDGFTGQSRHGRVIGGGGTIAAGEGASIFAGYTYTRLTPSFNIFKLAAKALHC